MKIEQLKDTLHVVYSYNNVLCTCILDNNGTKLPNAVCGTFIRHFLDFYRPHNIEYLISVLEYIILRSSKSLKAHDADV